MFGGLHRVFSVWMVTRSPLPDFDPIATNQRIRRRGPLCLEPRREQEDQYKDGTSFFRHRSSYDRDRLNDEASGRDQKVRRTAYSTPKESRRMPRAECSPTQPGTVNEISSGHCTVRIKVPSLPHTSAIRGDPSL